MESWNAWHSQFFVLTVLHGWVISRLLLGRILSCIREITLFATISLKHWKDFLVSGKKQAAQLILQGKVFPSLLSLVSIPELSQEELDKRCNTHSCWNVSLNVKLILVRLEAYVCSLKMWKLNHFLVWVLKLWSLSSELCRIVLKAAVTQSGKSRAVSLLPSNRFLCPQVLS